MRKNNKDYMPWAEYIQDREQKRAYAEKVAAAVHAITAQHHVDVGMLIGELSRGLLNTWKAAESLGLSSRAFLRLRRKYGLEPLQKVWLDAQRREYLYSPQQLTRIPPYDIQLAQRRSAMAHRAAVGHRVKKPVFDPRIDLEKARKLVA